MRNHTGGYALIIVAICIIFLGRIFLSIPAEVYSNISESTWNEIDIIALIVLIVCCIALAFLSRIFRKMGEKFVWMRVMSIITGVGAVLDILQIIFL
jgi:ABC-type uncharacterized transport system permease subunit